MASKKALRMKSSISKVQSSLLSMSSTQSFDKTFTLTFGDVAENHVGMQKIGSLAHDGFDLEDLRRAEEWFTARGVTCEVVELNELITDDTLRQNSEEAYILIARNALTSLHGDPNAADILFQEQDALPKDTKAKMYGRVVTKHARHNLCFGEVAQIADYEAGKGSVIAYSAVPNMSLVRQTLPSALGDKARELVVEGNYYFSNKCGIGYHGDAERRRVVGVRLGASLPLCFCWFHQNKSISPRLTFNLNHGDVYVFSEKATGYDWKKRIIPTLRHAAGAEKYISLPKE